ncbi:MAG: hypothetical protein OZSIB_3701 [Candidatus Ozemobacter sibiricus]|uniref:Uncharacterized protein n=1 Tax=Candidatus Ozemobacter sibiricus TaxID=2268124 RepID=A0A367ZF57_9BACT|nr:MAG: hypothetical protein OZSIB_3701 [Candidatus Ozemobacter sibiricus]
MAVVMGKEAFDREIDLQRAHPDTAENRESQADGEHQAVVVGDPAKPPSETRGA